MNRGAVSTVARGGAGTFGASVLNHTCWARQNRLVRTTRAGIRAVR